MRPEVLLVMGREVASRGDGSSQGGPGWHIIARVRQGCCRACRRLPRPGTGMLRPQTRFSPVAGCQLTAVEPPNLQSWAQAPALSAVLQV